MQYKELINKRVVVILKNGTRFEDDFTLYEASDTHIGGGNYGSHIRIPREDVFDLYLYGTGKTVKEIKEKAIHIIQEVLDKRLDGLDYIPQQICDEMIDALMQEGLLKIPNDKECPPSVFHMRPWNSSFGKMEPEMVAENIMLILKRTGDTFRKLTWEEYKAERVKDLKDGDMPESVDCERKYFDQVSMCCVTVETTANFSHRWMEAYNDWLKNN